MAPVGSLLARSSRRTQAPLGLLAPNENELFGGSTPEDFADPDWAGFIQETKRGAKSSKRYDDVVGKVAAEREVDIDIHSGFHDLEQDDAEEQKWLNQDSDLR